MSSRALPRRSRRGWRRTLRIVALAAITPLLEKNVVKRLAVEAPLVFSMSRLIVLAFAAGMLRQIWRAGVAGWPEATLSIAIVLAMPILGALERAKPAEVIALAKVLVGRLGTCDGRRLRSVFAQEPSKYDDHRVDA